MKLPEKPESSYYVIGVSSDRQGKVCVQWIENSAQSKPDAINLKNELNEEISLMRDRVMSVCGDIDNLSRVVKTFQTITGINPASFPLSKSTNKVDLLTRYTEFFVLSAIGGTE